MGSLFEPGITQASSLSPDQQGVHAALADLLREQLEGGFDAGSPFLRSTRRLFRKGVLEPSLRAFDREIAPRISLGFAQHGGTLSSRRGKAIADALEGLHVGAQAQLAGFENDALNRLMNVALGFSTASTQENIVQPSIGSQLLGLGGTIFGVGDFGNLFDGSGGGGGGGSGFASPANFIR